MSEVTTRRRKYHDVDSRAFAPYLLTKKSRPQQRSSAEALQKGKSGYCLDDEHERSKLVTTGRYPGVVIGATLKLAALVRVQGQDMRPANANVIKRRWCRPHEHVRATE